MWFWWCMFASVLICPLTMILSGLLMWKHCAKGKPGAVGYRTRRSVASRETWQFANEDCGKRMWRWGWITMLPSVLAMLPVYGASEDTVGILGGLIVMVECVIMLALIIPTERALKANFGE